MKLPSLDEHRMPASAVVPVMRKGKVLVDGGMASRNFAEDGITTAVGSPCAVVTSFRVTVFPAEELVITKEMESVPPSGKPETVAANVKAAVATA